MMANVLHKLTNKSFHSHICIKTVVPDLDSKLRLIHGWLRDDIQELKEDLKIIYMYEIIFYLL